MTDPYQASTSYSISLSIENDPPTFIGGSTPSNIRMHVGELKSHFLPIIESNFPDTDLQVVHDLLPSFVSFNRAELMYSIAPSKRQHLGTSIVRLRLKDPVNESEYSFSIMVSNDPPQLVGPLED